MDEKFNIFEKNNSPDKVKLIKITLFGLFLLLFCAISFISNIISSQKDSIDLIPEKSDDSSQIDIIKQEHKDIENQEFPVYITGEVYNPGIYLLDKTLYLYEIIEMAGGLTENAATDYINMVFIVDTNKTIKIPSKTDMENLTEKEITQEILIEQLHDSLNSNRLININTASLGELETLPGIGPSTAQAILDHRNSFGKFNKIEDVMLVSGIKDSKFNLIKEKITVTN